jgi:tripartite-type tricarboxylate transporter receptor subunit TctC
MKRVLGLATLAAAVLAIGLQSARAQTAGSTAGYPSRSVKVVIPFAPGGVVDIIGRLLAQKLSEALGRSFYIDNLGGAGGNIGVANVALSRPDGYTLLMTSSSFVVNPSLHKKVPYNPYNDFAPVTIAAASPNILVVNPSESSKTVKELIVAIKQKPGTYSFGSPGTGTTPHLSGELFRLSFGLDMIHVPFTGAGPALQATVGGHTPIAFSSVPAAVPLIKGGALRALATTSSGRLSALPDLPTMAEAGAPGQEAETLLFVMFPVGTSKDIVDLIYRTIAKIVQTQEIKEKFEALGFLPMAATPEESAARIKDEIVKWAKVIHDAHIQEQ